MAWHFAGSDVNIWLGAERAKELSVEIKKHLKNCSFWLAYDVENSCMSMTNEYIV